jgi:hypothetical protein
VDRAVLRREGRADDGPRCRVPTSPGGEGAADLTCHGTADGGVDLQIEPLGAGGQHAGHGLVGDFGGSVVGEGA